MRLAIHSEKLLSIIFSLIVAFSVALYAQDDLQELLRVKLNQLDSLRQEMQKASDAGEVDRYNELKPIWEKMAEEVNQIKAKLQSDRESLAKAVTFLKEGADHLKAGRNGEAVVSFIHSLRYDPFNHQTYHNLGYAFFGISQSPVTYNSFLQTRSQTDTTLVNYFRNLNKEEGLKKGTLNESDYLEIALKTLLEAVKINPQYTSAWVALGRVASSQGNDDAALQYYNRAIEINSGESKALYGLGTIYFRKGEYNRAEALYQSAVQADSTYADAWLGLGRALKEQGKTKPALEALANAAKYGPRNHLTFVLMAELYNLEGDYSQALSAADKAIALKPRYAPAWYEKGVALSHLNRKGEAENAFLEAKKDPVWRERADYQIKLLKGTGTR